MIEIEREYTYLVKYLPDGLFDCPSKEMIDLYIPDNVIHPTLRIRKQGEKMMITKKTPVEDADRSIQQEQTITLNQLEYDALTKSSNKCIQKTRYYYPRQWHICEIDIFTGGLQGLVVVDIEFKNIQEMKEIMMPEFCLADITQDERIAGGMLAGKTYEEIKPRIMHYGYNFIS